MSIEAIFMPKAAAIANRTLHARADILMQGLETGLAGRELL